MTAPSGRKFTYDFSIWYCPEDDSIASDISKVLMKEGFQGYAEHQDQVAGTSVIWTATRVIQASRVAIILLSTRSLGDPWCQRICEWILDHNIHEDGTKVIPVYVHIKKNDVPMFLQHFTELEYGNTFFYTRLVNSLRKSRSQASKARCPCSSSAAQAKS